MKKIIQNIFLILIIICLSSCDINVSKNIEVQTDTDTTSNLVEENVLKTFVTKHEDFESMIVEQSNRHNLNAFCYDNSWLYGTWSGTHGKGEVVKLRFDDSDWTVINKNTNGYLATCQAIKAGYLYYSCPTETTNELIKVRASGEEPRVIIQSHSGSIQICNDYIYYTTQETWNDNEVTQDSSHLYRCGLDGENVELIIDKPVYYFTVFDDFVLYQDDKDNVSLHMYNINERKDSKLNNIRSFNPIFDGEHIYFLSDSFSEEEYKFKLYRMLPDGNNLEEINVGCFVKGLIMNESKIYYINVDDNHRIYRCNKDGTDIELISQTANVLQMQFVHKALAYTTFSEEGKIDRMCLCHLDGSENMDFYEFYEYQQY